MAVKVKGMYDLYGEKAQEFLALEKFLTALFRLYNYEYFRTPNLEYSEVFHRDGEFSDAVTKETYNFKDKGNRNLTLRPEGTAGLVRSYIENKLYADNELKKYYYLGPNYRYERPQKGRFREFYQFGVEVLGVKNPAIDAEVIALAYKTVNLLGLKNIVVKINSLGDTDSKSNYEKALKFYFKDKIDNLCDDCHERYLNNPLRILDCKIDAGKKEITNAPKSRDYLTNSSKEYFLKTLEILNLLQIKYIVDDNLVRGLDYYTEIVFEIVADIQGFGNANTLGGGGRYDNLVKELGGPSVSAIGYSFGVERLLMALEESNIKLQEESFLDAYLLVMDGKFYPKGLEIIEQLRDNQLKAELNYMSTNFKTSLKKALLQKPRYLIFLGEEELQAGFLTVKNTLTETQEKVVLSKLVNYIKGV